MHEIAVTENGLHLVLRVTDDGDVRLLHLGTQAADLSKAPDEKQQARYRLLEVQCLGFDQDDHHANKYTGTCPARDLRYRDHRDMRNQFGRKLEVEQEVGGLAAVSHLQFFDGIPVIRAWTELINRGDEEYVLEYVSSFALTGVDGGGIRPWNERMRLHVPHNTWCGEAQWRSSTLPEAGLYPVNASAFSLKRVACSAQGTWSCADFLPMGALENVECGTTLAWQIEHNGSWHWEVSDIVGRLYVRLAGPTFREGHWSRVLKAGEEFCSVPAAVAAVEGNLEEGLRQLIRYRRAIRRVNDDNRNLPVIFNDYMNCLWGDPTTEKLLPLIDAAARAGCEYFCIDSGWYGDGFWWDSVGLWEPSAKRFPDGLTALLQRIRQRGMVPGLWLELEVVGVKSPLLSRAPDSWFFQRAGRKVIDHGRYQLDFRNPDVRAYADGVVDRLVREYGVGYIKMDYNINAGPGTDFQADSVGDGLLGHSRGYLEWLDGVFERWPDLVIENCGSGGMRMDWALLCRHSIQSSSDQTDYRKTAVIAASVVSVTTPEQCAVWSYPLTEADDEAVVFNMVNTLLLRIHQSGHLAAMDARRHDLVRQALDYYRRIRGDIPRSLPFWPLGLPKFGDPWVSLGLQAPGRTYLAVWRLEGGTPTCVLPIRHLLNRRPTIRCAYPDGRAVQWAWDVEAGALGVMLDEPFRARLFELA